MLISDELDTFLEYFDKIWVKSKESNGLCGAGPICRVKFGLFGTIKLLQGFRGIFKDYQEFPGTKNRKKRN